MTHREQQVELVLLRPRRVPAAEPSPPLAEARSNDVSCANKPLLGDETEKHDGCEHIDQRDQIDATVAERRCRALSSAELGSVKP